MARDGVNRVGSTNSIDAHGQIPCELVVDEHPPVYVVGIGKDGRIAWSLHLVPTREGSIPRCIEIIEVLVLLA